MALRTDTVSVAYACDKAGNRTRQTFDTMTRRN